MADGQFDDLLLGLAKQHTNVEELSFSILSFFERRTDLFHEMEQPNERMGFMPGVAEKMMLKHFRFFQHRYVDRCQPHLLSLAEGAAGAEAAATGEAPDAAASSSSSPAPAGGYKAEAPPTAPSAAPASAEEEGALPEQTRKMMRHISTWNGAVTSKYHWSQSIAEVTVEVEVADESRAKDIIVDMTATRLAMKCKGATLLEGKLHEKINMEESIWHLDDNKIVLTMEKQRQTWWKCVLEGDEEIDTTKVESTRTMQEYDGETQGAIRKIMFDQTQKAQGKPTSDQIKTAGIMKDAWNAPGSPFRGTEFDPTLLNLSGPVPDDFFEDVEKRKIDEAVAKKRGADPGSAQG